MVSESLQEPHIGQIHHQYLNTFNLSKLVDLYQLQGNGYVLSFLRGLYYHICSNTYLHYHKINMVTTPNTQQPAY